MVIDESIRRVLFARPERIVGFDSSQAESLRGAAAGRKAALLEIAGRDSVAAGIEAVTGSRYDLLIPTIVYTGTEYGDWEVVMRNVETLQKRIANLAPGAEVTETVVIGSPAWWHAVSGRFVTELFRLYGFSPACISCHMYLHASRVPLAQEIGVPVIIAGERESHDGRQKLNQLGPVLEAYSSVLAEAGVFLFTPLAKLSEGRQVEDILGSAWQESERQLQCVFEANYRDASGRIASSEGGIKYFLDEFLVPVFLDILSSFRENRTPPDYMAVVGAHLARCKQERT